jgi:LysR family hydrogen peroxide-inducible transcriptional activator
MNIQQIEYILAVVELENFSLAADKCFVTQSTLSTMIRRFESEIGVKVFDRKTKPVSITKEGESVIKQLRKISTEVRVLEELVQSLKGELSGSMNIGIIPTVAPFILPEFLNDFAEKFPKIQFTVSEMTTQNIIELLQKRELDIGILATPLHEADLTEIPLYNESFVLYDCSDEHKATYANLETIDYNKFWLLEEGHCFSNQVMSICDLDDTTNKAGINFNFRAGSIDSLIRFVKINKGITMLPYLASLEFNTKEHKKVKYFDEPVPVRTIGLVVHKHFVKQQILDLLKTEIMDKILPMLNTNGEEVAIAP